MFERSVVTRNDAKTWPMLASMTLQSAFVGSVILVSILNIESLGLVKLPDPLPPLPARPIVELVAPPPGRSAATSSLVMQPRPFTQPFRIPDRVFESASIEPGAPLIATGASDGNPLGIPGSITGIAGAAVTRPVPPPPQPKIEEKQAPTAPVPVGGKVLEAMILKRVLPVYPQIARSARISGVVRLTGVIAKDGTIQKLQVISGHPLLVASALEAVRQWVYRPTMLNGQAVEVTAPIEVNFTLSQ